MILLPPELRAVLIENALTRRAAIEGEWPEPDALPVLKLFSPLGAATWLLSELDEDGDTLFGLADLGFGCPEMGYASLTEIASVRLPFGLTIERDLHFTARFGLTVYAEAARIAGRITEDETALIAAARAMEARRAAREAAENDMPSTPDD